tara:strand:+ start:329 stop:1189 length:861 start_codon:yes stop_codon:yes gene_type:complete
MAYGTLNAGTITPGSGNTLTVSETVSFTGAVTGTTIDATTDFTVGGTVLTDGNIADTGTLALVPVDGCTIALGTDAGDDFNVGSGKLVVEGDTGKVGIGTATPAARLTIKASDATSLSSCLHLESSGGHNWYLHPNSSDTSLYINYNGSVTPIELRSNGDIFTSGVYGTGIQNDTYRDMLVRNDGLLGANTSSLRYKEDVKDMPDTSWIYDLRPVDFKWKESNTRSWGLIAEEVEVIEKRLVTYDLDGLVDGVTYSKLVPLLLKAIQELSAKNDALEARILTLESA